MGEEWTLGRFTLFEYLLVWSGVKWFGVLCYGVYKVGIGWKSRCDQYQKAL